MDEFGFKAWQNNNKKINSFVLYPQLKGDVNLRSQEAVLEETSGLVEALPNSHIIYRESFTFSMVRPATYMGRGKVEEIKDRIEKFNEEHLGDEHAQEIEVIVVNAPLSPIQQRNLEKEWDVKVIDRTGLILEIFSNRATTKEGKMQVELAFLMYQKTRLVKAWTHLERQRGGTGSTGGPGETQIEIDRRLINDKIKVIKGDLEDVKRTRSLHRKKRKELPAPVVSLVGYTNAGKSTLFNKITKSEVFAQDLLFATLSPTMRKLKLPSGKEIILSDTVGFISELPHELVEAFLATLEEVSNAEIVLHVEDSSHADYDAQRKDVEKVLKDIIDEDVMENQLINVFNKSDNLSTDRKDHFTDNVNANPKNAVMVSALNGNGIDDLLGLVDDMLSINDVLIQVHTSAGNGKAISWLHANSNVLNTEYDDMGDTTISIKISPRLLNKFKKEHTEIETIEAV